jgi:hypothetical protein
LVLVACEVVALRAVKFWRVDDALATKPLVSVWSNEKVFAVVVPKAVEIVFTLRESGYVKVSGLS